MSSPLVGRRSEAASGRNDAPLVATGKQDREDTSVDTSVVTEPPTERQRVAEQFGDEYLTSPAGVPLPDTGDAGAPPPSPGNDAEKWPAEHQEAQAEAGLSAGDEPRLLAGGELAAAEAAEAAKRLAPSNDDAMFHALEAAEEAYTKQHPEEAAAGVNSPAKAADTVEEQQCAEARTAIASSLQRSAAELQNAVGSEGAEGLAAATAASVEAAIFEATTSSTVYRSAVANAVRLAPTVAEPSELARIALGKPEEVPAAEILALLADSSGLNGSGFKPYYT